METIQRQFSYSITEAAAITGINRKRIERQCKKDKIAKRGKGYVLDGSWLIDTFKLDVSISNDINDKTTTKVVNMSNKNAVVSNREAKGKRKDNENKLENYISRQENEFNDIHQIKSQVESLIERNNQLEKTIENLKNEKRTEYINQNKSIIEVKEKTPEAAVEYSEKLNAKLEKQFKKGVKHISINKELPNEIGMNKVDFSTRLHHLRKLEDTYPAESKNSGPKETTTTITRKNGDGEMETTVETSTDFDKKNI